MAFLRLHGAGDKFVISEDSQDHGPGKAVGFLPHTWAVGEIVPDDWALAIPANAPPGRYDVELGVYDYRDLKRIPLGGNDPNLANRLSAIITGVDVASP